MTTPETMSQAPDILIRKPVAYRILNQAASLREGRQVWVYVDARDYVEGVIQGVVEKLYT